MIKVSGAKTAVAVTSTLAAWFRYGLGITSSGGAVSAWADQSGNGRNLVQATGAKQPALQSDGSILFDGVNDFLKCSGFSIGQPESIYLLFKPLAWTDLNAVFDGNTQGSVLLTQHPTTPQIQMYAGSFGPVSAASTPALTAYTAVGCVYSGASSVLNVDGVETTGDANTADGSGFTLASDGSGTVGFTNMQVKEVLIYTGAHDAGTRAQLISYLKTL